MVSNTVSADGTGWTFTANTVNVKDSVVITTQCAPLRDSYVSANGTPAPRSPLTFPYQHAFVYGSCRPGYTALSGGVYQSKLDGNEDRSGFIDFSIPVSGNRWYTDGVSFDSIGVNKLVALEQCIR
jgi:hypothetical protein